MTKNRKHICLPAIARCPFKSCVYNESGICDDVVINKGNGDSDCHTWKKSRLIEKLEKYPEGE